MDAYTLNLLGAFAVGCFDLQQTAMGEGGLTPAELAALLGAYTRPDSTVREIAVATGLTHSGAVRTIDRIELAKWVERRTGRDRRTVEIRCTAEGRKKVRHALALRKSALTNVAKVLPKSDLAAFRRLAKKFLSQLPEDRSDAWRICRLCEHGVCRGAKCPVGSAVE